MKKLRKNLSMNKRNFIQAINHNNQIITDRYPIAEKFADYFEEIYKSENPRQEEETKKANTTPEIDNINENIEISLEEVKKTIKEMKKEKIPGEDGITNEIIKLGGSKLANHIRILFN